MKKVEKVSTINHSKFSKYSSDDKIKKENSRQKTKNFKQQYNKFEVKQEIQKNREEEKIVEDEKESYISPKHQMKLSETLNTYMQRRRLGFDKKDDRER